MNAERAPIFSDDDLDLSEFSPATHGSKRPDAAAIRGAAVEHGFVSREVGQLEAQDSPRLRRRYTTGRNRQLNMKVTDNALKRFYALADANGWVLGETFEHAVGALEQTLKTADD